METNNDYNFGRLRVNFHEFCNFIPIVSTISNTIAVVEKYLYVPDLDSDHSLDNDFYYSYLKAKDFRKEWQLFIPGLNFIFCVLRCCCISPGTDTTVDENRPADDPADDIDNKKNDTVPFNLASHKNDAVAFYVEKIQELKNKTNEKLPEILNEIIGEVSEEEKIALVKEVSSSLNEFLEFFKIPCPNSISSGEQNDLVIWVCKIAISSIISLCDNISIAQLVVLIQGFKNCRSDGFRHNGHPNHRWLTIIYELVERRLFPEVINLYSMNPDLAKLMLQEIVRTYSFGKTEDNKALDYLVQCIRTKEQAVDYLEACKDLPKSIKEDNYLKLALHTQSYSKWRPAVFREKGQDVFLKEDDETKTFHFAEKDAIIAAFNEMEIDYVAFLPKNNWLNKDINQDIVNVIYTNLPIDALAKMSRTCKIQPEESSVASYVQKHLKGGMPTRLTRLFELYSRLTQSRESSKQKSLFLEMLDGMLQDLKKDPNHLTDTKLLSITKLVPRIGNNPNEIVTASQKDLESFNEVIERKTFKNHLFDSISLFSKLTFSSESDAVLLSNCLDLLFQKGSDEQLVNFIDRILQPSTEELRLGEKCFYDQLTDERLGRLASAIKNRGFKNCHTLLLQKIYNSASKAQRREEKDGPNNVARMIELAESLTIAFYIECPEDLIKWASSTNQQIPLYCICLADILVFLTESIKHEKQTRQDLNDWSMKNTVRNSNLKKIMNTPVYRKYIESILSRICVVQEDFAITEKKLVDFVRSILIQSPLDIDPYERYKLLFSACSAFNREGQEQTAAAIQTIIYKTMLDIFLMYGKHISKLTACIETENQFHIFHKLILELPQPIRTIQLSILRDHVCNEANDLSKNLCNVFNDHLLISGMNQDSYGMLRIFNETQEFADEILALKTPEQLEEWLKIKENKKEHFKLQAVAQGIKMPDGSLLQCPLEAEEIEKAFLSEKLYYKGYEEPIDLKSFIDDYHGSTK